MQQIIEDDIATHHLVFLFEHYNPNRFLSIMQLGATYEKPNPRSGRARARSASARRSARKEASPCYFRST